MEVRVVVDRGPPPAGDGWLSPRERRIQAGMRADKRRREWRLGRWVGKRALVDALRAAGRDTPPRDHLEILPAPDGAPQAYRDGRPLPLVLSLSHRGQLAACAVAPAGVALGCDLELLEPRSELLIADHFTAAEAARIAAAADPETAVLLANLTWSATESVLKALRTGLRRDTRGVEVELAAPAESDGGGAWHPLTVSDHDTGIVYPGRWRRLGDTVLTVVTDQARVLPC